MTTGSGRGFFIVVACSGFFPSVDIVFCVFQKHKMQHMAQFGYKEL
jgi:hypothetical protein